MHTCSSALDSLLTWSAVIQCLLSGRFEVVMQRFPPTPAELRSAADGGAEAPPPKAANGAAAQQSSRTGNSAAPTAAELSPEAVAAKHAAWQRQQARPEIQALAAARAKLPISSFR